MFKACWSLGKEDFAGVEFLRQASGAPVDAMDDYAAHVFVSGEDNEPIAAGRMYPVGDALRIDRLVVAAKYATLPYEELTLRMLLYRARELPQSVIEVEPAPGVAGLLPRFGFAPDENNPRLVRCPREGITWFSQCGD
ncbi:MAG: hypothetical protein BWY35_00123 [Firmicutes bacterium ADurb.Bin248]|nr:MAG: hypothetical protein BWY35_00123 [Firmicutes bacterium ADurb.Bin248]HOG02277.1 hypothetical protein [Clostridia bacterium]HPK16957.1 hypothetical protein [Clostridia bacterium]